MPEIQKEVASSAEDTLRFLDLIGLFSSQAMIALGKLANPATGKAEKNLAAARLFIDLLEMIERKTQNNLTRDETRALQATLTDLRLMYVEESSAPAAAATTPPADKPADKAADQPAPAAAPDESKVKFRKKYES